MSQVRPSNPYTNGVYHGPGAERRWAEREPAPSRGPVGWLADAAQRLQEQVRPLAHEVADRVSHTVHDSTQAGTRWMMDGRDQLARQSSRAARRAVGQVRHRPVSSLLAAAATGAVLYALASRVLRSNGR